jgi:hypothetical protein
MIRGAERTTGELGAAEENDGEATGVVAGANGAGLVGAELLLLLLTRTAPGTPGAVAIRRTGHVMLCLVIRRLSEWRVIPRRAAAPTMEPPSLRASTQSDRSTAWRLNVSMVRRMPRTLSAVLYLVQITSRLWGILDRR